VVVEQGLPLIESLNLGLARARARLIARMDADDVARPDRFAKQVAFLERHPDVVALSGAVDVIDEGGRYVETIAFPTLPAAIADELIHRPIVVHPSAMARTAALREIGGYRPIARYAEDYDLWLRLAERGAIANLPDVLLSYRLHTANASRLRFVEQELAVLAARAAARRRRSGEEDPLSRVEQGARGDALTLARLRQIFGADAFAREFAFAFFRGTLTKASDMNLMPTWLRLFARYGLRATDPDGARLLLLIGGSLMLKRRRAGASAAALSPFFALAALLALRHPRAILGEVMRLPRWQRIARGGLLGPRAGASGG
jgi:hypothetical protein